MATKPNTVRNSRLGVGTPPSLRRWFDRKFEWPQSAESRRREAE